MWPLRSASVWKSERKQTLEKVGTRQRITDTSRITWISRISTVVDALLGFQLASKCTPRNDTIGKTLYERFVSRELDVENAIHGNVAEGLDTVTCISLFSFDLAFDCRVLYSLHHYLMLFIIIYYYYQVEW